MGTHKQPAAFIGHGSPMNVILHNPFTRFLQAHGENILRNPPSAVLVVSAHWLTKGTYITAAARPGQIYDFFGFPPELYQIEYHAPGHPELAQKIASEVGVQTDMSRGIDHAAWALAHHLFPKADIPILEISLDMTLSFQEHYELGKKLRSLSDQNILVIGSGNLVHNLRDISFDENEAPYQWAIDIDNWIKQALNEGDIQNLIDILEVNPGSRRGIPTSEHYLPLLYILAMLDEHDKMITLHESIQHASISMRSIEIRHTNQD